MKVLVAECLPVHPESAREFLGQGGVKVLRTQPSKDTYGKGTLTRAAQGSTAKRHRKGPGAVRVNNSGEFVGHFFNGLFPRYFLKFVADLFKGVGKTIGMVLIKLDAQSLATRIPLSERIILVAANLDYLIVFDPYLEPAQIASQHTVCLFPVHYYLLYKTVMRVPDDVAWRRGTGIYMHSNSMKPAETGNIGYRTRNFEWQNKLRVHFSYFERLCDKHLPHMSFSMPVSLLQPACRRNYAEPTRDRQSEVRWSLPGVQV